MSDLYTSSQSEFVKWAEYYFEKYPLHKEVYANYLTNGQCNRTCWMAEKFYNDNPIGFKYALLDKFLVVNIIDPFSCVLFFPKSFLISEDEKWIKMMICGLATEQLENSPHKYRKCLQNGLVLDIGCSEGIFPASYCDSTNRIIGIDSNEDFCEAFLNSCNSNNLKNFSFLPAEINRNTVLDNIIPEDENVVTIKMDIEGYELEALIALKTIIEKHHPQLQIACYHSDIQFKECLEYCINILGYSNFDFNKNHLIFGFDKKFPISENWLRQGVIIANY